MTWINVKHKLPDLTDDVFCVLPQQNTACMYDKSWHAILYSIYYNHESKKWEDGEGRYYEITHWMLPPEMPDEQTSNNSLDATT